MEQAAFDDHKDRVGNLGDRLQQLVLQDKPVRKEPTDPQQGVHTGTWCSLKVGTSILGSLSASWSGAGASAWSSRWIWGRVLKIAFKIADLLSARSVLSFSRVATLCKTSANLLLRLLTCSSCYLRRQWSSSGPGCMVSTASETSHSFAASFTSTEHRKVEALHCSLYASHHRLHPAERKSGLHVAQRNLQRWLKNFSDSAFKQVSIAKQGAKSRLSMFIPRPDCPCSFQYTC